MNNSPNFWRTGLIMFLIIVGGLSLLPYIIPTGADQRVPESPFAESRFQAVGGVTLHYREFPARPAEGQAVRGQLLLVHGLAGSTYSWRHVHGPLQAAGYHVLTVDVPPFGYSEPIVPGAEGPDEAELLWGLIDALGEQRGRWHLVGHSMGSAVVARMAAAAPDRVDQLVMVAGTHETASEGGAGIGGVIMQYPPVQRWLTVIGSRRLLNEPGMERALSSAYGQEVEEAVVAAYLAPLRIRGKPDAVIRGLQAGSPPLASAELRPFSLNLIWGGHDEWVPLSHGRRLAEAAEAELHLLDEAAHNPMETHPDAFLDRLLAILP
ncbi:alpha/beta fold hydrolase [Natronospira bacteriovora]|uniref:Alpha/beta hydrolase n=1 Tax=Natronospira bacteriovora TaxID=3069753 RepID=A0ABU0W7F1_9GAMM|nr:alpha/beta hydrolase [Natronospira sp. AB-CW4]MDQ2069954.1 alpha/beta hydrolase [Natronospira sp. AB-CW4]